MKKWLTHQLALGKYALAKFVLGMVLLAVIAWHAGLVYGQSVGYIYPAGGQQGSTFEMLLAGSGISNAQQIIIPGGGIDIKILERPRYGTFLHQDPYGGKCVGVWREIMNEESRIMAKRSNPAELEAARQSLRENRRKRREATVVKSNEIPTPPDEDVFRSTLYWHKLKAPSLADLQQIFYEYDGGVIDTNKKRHSENFGSTLVVSVTIAPDAKPGVCELFIMTNSGLSRAVKFWVSDVREVNEIEPNEFPIEKLADFPWAEFRRLFKSYVQLEAQELPVVINGQIKPGDVDRFQIVCKKDQRLVLDVQARATAPFIANAVPGYFCAVVTLLDAKGNKLKYTENYRFDQNPLMFYRIPEDGKYTVMIHDSIFRGRNDFVYRLSMGEFPVVYSQFPLGGRANETTTINIMGGNLPVKEVTPDFMGDVFYQEMRMIDRIGDVMLARPMRYMVETLPIYIQPVGSSGSESYAAGSTPAYSSSARTAVPQKALPTKVDFPVVVYGRINKIGDVGEYQFQGKSGQQIALDVTAQPLGSALDASIELRDSSGKIIAANDDRADSKGPNIGLEICHSDPALVVTLPADGLYTARVFSTFRRAGNEYFYRLRLSEPQPDFDICLIPSCLRFNGKTASFSVRVFRKEGFSGEIQLKAVGQSAQMKISNNGTIAPDQTEASFTIVTEEKLPANPSVVEIVAEATVGGKTLTNKVLPSDDWEQAFIWHHWVPASALMATQR